jgi:hypothetical protein
VADRSLCLENTASHGRKFVSFMRTKGMG